MCCRPVNNCEITGTCIIIIAATLMICDPYAKRIGESPNIYADLVSLFCSIPMALYFKFTSMLTEYLTMAQIVFLQINLCTIIFTGFAIICEGADFTTSDSGLFGWLRPENFMYSVVLYGFMSGFMG